MNQKKFLSNLLNKNPNAVIIGSLGTICYDLKDIPHKNKILLTGGMGCAVGVALGYALSSPKKKVICIVGDGAFQMKQGSINTVVAYHPKNLKIHLIDNGVYASTGGQRINEVQL